MPAISLPVRVDEHDTFAIHENEVVQQFVIYNGDPDTLEAWDTLTTDWQSVNVADRIRVRKDEHTLLLRIPDVLGQPHLGVEMAALYIVPEIIVREDARHISNVHKAMEPQPFASRNGMKEEAEIDLVAEEERDITARLSKSTVNVGNRGVINVDEYWS